MTTYANTSAVPLSLAVFLATDGYDHDSSTISATALMKPLRQIILGNRMPEGDASVDLIQMVPSRMGSAIHDGIERAWLHNHAVALKSLGYPDKVIDRVLINPEPEDLYEDCIPIYMEQRAHKQVGKYVVSGKFDFVGDGRVEDFKSTGVFTAINHTNDDKHTLQLSLYRWLNPEIITKDDGVIQFIFTDWSSARARTEAKYPPQRIQQRILPLKSVAETERYVINKLALIDKHELTPEADLPLCTDEDLWRSAPVFKYYKNPEKLARSTKNFDTKPEAYIRMAEEGGKGIVLEKPGQVMACKYCNAFALCSQKDDLVAAGDLVL
jgi:hypothetical protein